MKHIYLHAECMDKASEACTARFQQELATRAFSVDLSLGRDRSVCNALAHIFCKSSDLRDIKVLAEKAILSLMDRHPRKPLYPETKQRPTNIVRCFHE